MLKSKEKPKSPEYYLVDRLPGSTIPFLLGRVVASTRSPLDEYAPEDPRPALNGQYLELFDENFSSLFSVNRDSTVEAHVCKLLNIQFGDSHASTQSRKAKVVRTRSLPQHREALASLLEQHRAAIVQLLGDNGGEGHMVVGVKSCIDGAHETKSGSGVKRKLQITLPAGVIVDAASHGAVHLGQAADLTAEMGSESTWSAEQAGEMLGEQVFAIRYRRLTLKRPFLSKKGEYVNYGKIEHAQFEGGVYSSTDREEISDDDDEEDEEGDIAENFEDNDVGLAAENAKDGNADIEDHFL